MDLVERIELIGSIHSLPWLEPVDVKLKPSNVAAAANSAPYCVACVLATGGFDLTFVDAASNAPDLSKIGPKILVRLEDRTGAEIVVRFLQWAIKVRSCRVSTRPPANPLGVDQHLEKFRSCCALSPLSSVRDGAESIAEAVMGLEDVASVRETNADRTQNALTLPGAGCPGHCKAFRGSRPRQLVRVRVIQSCLSQMTQEALHCVVRFAVQPQANPTGT